jgi:dolichyl-phosphate-mannose--protein O-mannosyl transferase
MAGAESNPVKQNQTRIIATAIGGLGIVFFSYVLGFVWPVAVESHLGRTLIISALALIPYAVFMSEDGFLSTLSFLGMLAASLMFFGISVVFYFSDCLIFHLPADSWRGTSNVLSSGPFGFLATAVICPGCVLGCFGIYIRSFVLRRTEKT